MGDETSPTARRAGIQFVLGAEVVVTALTRSVRNIVPIGENGTGAGVAGGKSVQGADVVVTACAARFVTFFRKKGRETRPLREGRGSAGETGVRW